MNGYSQRILDYAGNGNYTGGMDDADGIGEVGLDGDRRGTGIAVRIFLKTEQQRIERVRFQAFGCGYTLAACAAAAELAENGPLADVMGITSAAIAERLGGLPGDRHYCAQLAAEALQAAAKSAVQGHDAVPARVMATDSHACPRVTADHPRYRWLMDSSCGLDVAVADRHLLACLLTVVEDEGNVAAALGLTSAQYRQLYARFFPAVEFAIDDPRESPENSDLVDLLLDYVPRHPADRNLPVEYLVRILAARATRPGHLWAAMGLFARAELTAAIQRHLPALATANSRGMRWKRFFYKQLCERSGGTLCKSPVCGDCPEYSLCFVS